MDLEPPPIFVAATIGKVGLGKISLVEGGYGA